MFTAIGINGVYGDADSMLREWAQQKFDLSSEVSSEPKGMHQLVRGPESMDVVLYWGKGLRKSTYIRVVGKTSPDSAMTSLIGDNFVVTDGNLITGEDFFSAGK